MIKVCNNEKKVYYLQFCKNINQQLFLRWKIISWQCDKYGRSITNMYIKINNVIYESLILNSLNFFLKYRSNHYQFFRTNEFLNVLNQISCNN